jgi:uncharacterized repeat protein (TIGR03803 family)
MTHKRSLFVGARLGAIFFAILLSVSALAVGQTEYLAYSFPLSTRTSVTPCTPKGNLVADSSGNLYGTATMCGASTGAVFELTRPVPPSKVWTEMLLDSSLAGDPEFGVIYDAAGNLYGTARGGATGFGFVFELSPPATDGGAWTETILYNFQGGLTDGATPWGGVTFDDAGNLYGVTLRGGSGTQEYGFCTSGCGVAYKLSRPATQGGSWTETVLHAFTAKAGAIFPVGAPIFDAKGNLYGGTEGGSSIGHSLGAAAYRLTPPAGGGSKWIYKLLYSFGAQGDGPQDSMTFHNGGHLYGTTQSGGEFNEGTVFELVPPLPGGEWTENVLYSFNGVPNDGFQPLADVAFDNAGNIYGTTQYGGSGQATCLDAIAGCGTVFKLVAPATEGGNWTETVLHSFSPPGVSPDGSEPSNGLLFWKNGVLFGGTPFGGRGGEGTVYGIVP